MNNVILFLCLKYIISTSEPLLRIIKIVHEKKKKKKKKKLSKAENSTFIINKLCIYHRIFQKRFLQI